MITINQGPNNHLEIRFNQESVILHNDRNPAFFVGVGKETIEGYRGNFQIEDYITERIPLRQVRVEGNIITFSHNEIQLTMSLELSEGRLVGSFHWNQPLNRFWMRLVALPDETVYGCGEQASYFNLRGRDFPLFTGESGVGRDKNSLTTFYANLKDKAGGDYYSTYYPETTFVSSRKYWFHLDTYAYANFNFKNKLFHEFLIWDLPQRMIIGRKDHFTDLLTDLTQYTGRPPMLPEFLLDGMILGVQGGLEQVMNYLRTAQSHGCKVSGLWCQDWAGYRFTTFGKRLYWNWVLNEKLYPDLKNKIADLEQENVRFLTYICPFVLENESLFNEAQRLGLLVLNQQNETYREDFGEFYCGLVDLTNPKAFDWYKEIIKKNIIALGIKGWMADFGEYLPTDCKLHNGVDALLMHNEWPVLWAKCNYLAVQETGNLGKVFYFMRAGGFLSQRYSTSMWAGDQSVNWEIHDGIASVIPAALSVGIIGNPFTHSDIGGYTSLHGNIRTKELFDRWCEMNVFTTYMRTHEGNRPKDNFQFYNDEDTMKLMGKMTTVRVHLKPYIQHLFQEATTLGYPVQRPMFLHYENDAPSYHLQYQYLFGKDMLIKPVIEEKQKQSTVYLPNDDWIHLWTGQLYVGGGNVVVDCPIGSPPVFYRKNSGFAELFSELKNR
ncbi:MAG: alpha-glucosidase [Bacillus subtilis]|nr:alpha-glucosidase [Bacillus subtilis]